MGKRVLVLGGGVAGLAAASRLPDCEVTIVEARSRLGGRINTIFSSNNCIELGAEFVHGQSRDLLDLINQADLKMQSASENNAMLLKEEWKSYPVWEKFGKLIEKVDPQQPDTGFDHFLESQHLRELDYKMMRAFAIGFNAAHGSRLSAHSLKRAQFAADQMGGDKQSRIREGYKALVDYLEQQVRLRKVQVMLKTEVKTVRWRQGSVELDVTQDGQPQTLLGDAAIVTLPLGVLKQNAVEFNPPLADKQEAIDGLVFGNVAKIIFVFKEKWWPKSDFGFVHAVEEAIPTFWSDPRGPVITGWAGGERADALINRSPAELRNLGLDLLAKVFSHSRSEIENHLSSFHFHNWAEDPHTRGAYTYISVNGLFLPKLLAAPVENTLFFAGEATAMDAQLGTVFAALETGYRAAREVVGG